MCTCASCIHTDQFSGWRLERARDGSFIPDESGGFNSWPRGEVSGSVTSAAEYRKHAIHCGSIGLPKPWRFVPGLPPKFRTEGLVMPIAPAPKFVHDWINARGDVWKESGPALPGPDVRPHAPGKARKHFPATDRRSGAGGDDTAERASATIYAMPKSKVKKPMGRPPLPGRRVVVKLEERHIKAAEKLGDENVARGIRLALERVKAG